MLSHTDQLGGPLATQDFYTVFGMTQDRLAIFESMAKDQPNDAMIWYGLANEYSKLERWAESADALNRVVEINPDYTAAYQLLGTALLNLGRTDEAKAAWRHGIEAADRTGAWKARQHMQGLLDGVADSSGLCSGE
jgi:tetratricopeptide (TPR) repeat protein